jgi:hypothetical protein
MGRVKEIVIEIIDLWINGCNFYEIAEKTNMTVQDIWYAIDNYATQDDYNERRLKLEEL